MSSDTDTAYYLLTHVLTHPSLFPSAVFLGDITKEVTAEAEVMAWGEIDKAKMFIRALGAWFAENKGAITEKEIERLAAEWGLGWKGDAEEEEVERVKMGPIEVDRMAESAVVA